MDLAGRCDYVEYFDTGQDANEAREFAKTQEGNEGFIFRIVRGEFLSGITLPHKACERGMSVGCANFANSR